MIHARSDYQRFQDPALHNPDLLSEGSTPIGNDEPVMLFRAQDKHFVDVLLHYAGLVAADPDTAVQTKLDMVGRIAGHMLLAKQWQEQYGCKPPDAARKAGEEPR